ncbi:MAG TPA: SDR family NAD(P)-dependent oxidoreductase [Acidimicrobiales bacterium]|nr:SDR family NAD(P)-dependent oxidoreductase [Acidimicrobiales bacterium]
MGILEGRVVVVTGAGRGLGREYARLAAAEGAQVVVDDVGCGPDGAGADPSLAEAVAGEINGAGGTAIARADDVRTMAGAEALLAATLEAFGTVDGLVANAGILRDRMFVNMSEDEWDDVVAGQLRATFCADKAFAGHWRDRSKAGEQPSAAIVNVSSTSGLIGAPGQSNYGAAKAGIASLSVILAQELSRYGIRVNALVPVARTRMTEDVPGVKEMVAKPDDPEAFDVYHPANVAPMVAYLLSDRCPMTGRTFYAKGGEVREVLNWQYGRTLERDQRWDPAELAEAMSALE